MFPACHITGTSPIWKCLTEHAADLLADATGKRIREREECIACVKPTTFLLCVIGPIAMTHSLFDFHTTELTSPLTNLIRRIIFTRLGSPHFAPHTYTHTCARCQQQQHQLREPPHLTIPWTSKQSVTKVRPCLPQSHITFVRLTTRNVV